MRSRGGAFALINYALYSILDIIAVAIFVLNFDAFQIPGLNVILFIFGYVAVYFAGYGIFLLVFKLLHMVTRFALFGIPCLLGDAFIIWHLVP